VNRDASRASATSVTTLIRALVIALALVEAGWMTFDGGRAFVVGDYVTPSTGAHAGELGPWHHVAEAVGIEPRSDLMKAIFVGYGVAWLMVIGGFMRRLPWAPTAMMVAAFGALWYLPIGTVCSILQIVGLLWLRRSA
jgi:uncharacterized membrane protein YphA (DoxX/SURF4 family)